ncbi:MAG: Sua5/YciO/YrdC/YwlC family protein, partial [Paludibacter sp.]
MKEEIKKALEILRNGGVILYPTDTVWGLGCDATNEKAVKRIFEIKKRADAKAMLVLVDSAAKIEAYISEVPDMA